MADLIITSSVYDGESLGAIPYPILPGATEALEYYTDVLPAYTNGAEERAQLRALPRQYYKHSLATNFDQMREVHNALRANLRNRWLIPEWFQAQRVSGVVAGQTVFPVDTLIHDLRANTHALLWKGYCDWQIVDVDTITATTITLSTPAAFAGSVLIVPFRVGRVSGSAKMSPSGWDDQFDLEYYVDDVLGGLTETPAQLNGQDYYTTPYVLDERNSTQLDWEEDQVEYVLGGIDSMTPWTRSMYTYQYNFDDSGPEAYWELKQWWYRRAGKFRPFYSPTFESDLQKRSTGTVTNTFQFQDEGYTAHLYPTLNRLGFLLKNGTWLARTVTAASNIGGGLGQVTLNAALNVAARDIERVSFILFNRLNTDRLELNLQAHGRFTTNASVLEIPE